MGNLTRSDTETESAMKKILNNQNSSDSLLNQKKFLSDKWMSILFCFVASLGYISSGALVAWSSNAYSKTENNDLTNYQMSLLAAVLAIGACISPILVYKSYYIVGTRFFILTSASFMISSSYLTSFWSSFWILLAGRLLGGLAIGTIFTLIPHYMDELSSKKYKYILDNILYIQFGFGVLIQYMADFIPDTQIIGVLTSTFPLFMFIGFLFMPESPRFLCATGKINSARAILKITNPNNISLIENTLNNWQDKNNISIFFKDCLKGAQNVRVLFPVCGLLIFQQAIGVIPLMFYYQRIFLYTAGDYSPSITSVLVMLIFVLSIPVYSISGCKLKDRTMLIWSCTVMAICLAVLGWHCHAQGSFGPSEDFGYIPVLCYGSFMFLYAIGFYRLPWKYMEVLVPEKNYFAVRSLATSFSWFLIYVFVRIIDPLITFIGVGWIYWNITIVLLFAIMFISLFVPDIQEASTADNKLFDNMDSSTDGESSHTSTLEV